MEEGLATKQRCKKFVHEGKGEEVHWQRNSWVGYGEQLEVCKLKVPEMTQCL